MEQVPKRTKLLLDASEVESITGISRYNLLKWSRVGDFPRFIHLKHRRKYYWAVKDVDEWIESLPVIKYWTSHE